MGFFASGGTAVSTDRRAPKVETLWRLQCRACPLNGLKGNHSPHMLATGSDNPLVYMLGEAPDESSDRRGKQFVGNMG